MKLDDLEKHVLREALRTGHRLHLRGRSGGDMELRVIDHLGDEVLTAYDRCPEQLLRSTLEELARAFAAGGFGAGGSGSS